VSNSWKVVEAVCLRRLGRYHTEIVHRVVQAAAESGSASVIASIMRHGHDGHFRAINHRKAFRSAIREGHADAAKLLMDWWPEVRSSINVETAIVDAASKGFFNIIKLLIDGIPSRSLRQGALDRALYVACLNGQTANIAELLIRYGADVNAKTLVATPEEGVRENTLAGHQLYEGNSATNRIGPSTEEDKSNGLISGPLSVAHRTPSDIPESSNNQDSDDYGSEKGNTEAKLGYGETLCRERRRALVRGTFNGQVRQPSSALQACLQPISRKSRRPENDLDAATARQDATTRDSVIRLLIESGADINEMGGSALSPVHYAVRCCTEETVRLMIAHGAEINKNTPEGGVPLQCAAGRETGSLPIVRALLDAGAEVPVDTADGVTSSPALESALDCFGPGLAEKRRLELEYKGFLHMEEFALQNGRFVESESVEEVLTTGPGAVIKLLLQTTEQLLATDERFCLLLQMAAASGDEDLVQLLIDRQVDVNATGHHYGTALQAASHCGRLGCVRKLLDAGAEACTASGNQGPALAAAVKGQHVGVVRALLNSDVRLHEDTTVLATAAMDGHLEIVRILLDAGADVNFCNTDCAPALVHACASGSIEIVDLLISRGADINLNVECSTTRDHGSIYINDDTRNGLSALHVTCRTGRHDIVHVLLLHGADIEQTIYGFGTPLAVAARAGHVSVMEQLAQAGAKIRISLKDANVFRSLRHVGNAEATIRFLLDNWEAADDDDEFEDVCEEALEFVTTRENSSEELFLAILKRKPVTTISLVRACQLGSRSAIEWILQQGIDINSDLGGDSCAVHIAAYYQQSALIPYLIGKGADVGRVSFQYGSPIYAALARLLPARISGVNAVQSQTGSRASIDTPFEDSEVSAPKPHEDFSDRISVCEEIIKILLDTRCSVSTEERATIGQPLHLAAYLGSLSLVKLLASAGADLNSAGGRFGSALVAAVCGQQEDVVRYLIQRGLDPNIASPKLGTALRYASKYGDRRMMQILLDHGADPSVESGPGETALSAVQSGAEKASRGVKHHWADKVNLLLHHGAGVK